MEIGASFVAYSESDISLFYFEIFFKLFFAKAWICAANFFGFFASVLSALAVIRRCTLCPVCGSTTDFFTKFRLNLLLVFKFEWDTLCPDFGFAPVSWQTLDIKIGSRLRHLRVGNKIWQAEFLSLDCVHVFRYQLFGGADCGFDPPRVFSCMGC